MAVYGVAGVLALALTLRYRQPLLLTGNVFVLIFIARLGTDIAWPELVGASMVAGAVVLVLGPLGLTKRLVAWLPAPIVFGLLSGAVLPFFVNMFTVLGDEPILVGGTLVVYLLARLTLEPRIPAILPALVAALLIAGLAGDLGGLSVTASLPAPVFTMPVFSLSAILTVSPVMVVLITLQANVPSIVFLREQDFQPPERVIGAVSGVGTIAGSLLGPTGISLSLPATALSAGPDAGEQSIRHLTVEIVAVAAIAIAVLAGFAVQLAAAIPTALLVTGVGLAVIGVLSNALQRVTSGPLIWGPLFAFAIALSDLSLVGLGPFFWAIAGGIAVSLLLEREQWKTLHNANAD
jgi:benzoate membrane transport protein